MTSGTAAASKVSVVHRTHFWLTQTMTWLYNQVRFLPPRIESHIVCDSTLNLDQYPIDNLVSTDRDHTPWRQLSARWPRVRHFRRSMLLRQTAKSSEAAIFHSHFGDQAWTDLDDVQQNGLRHVVTFYGYDVSRLPFEDPTWRERYLELFERADLFLCEGPHLADCLAALGCPREKLRVQHLGIDLESIPYVERSWRPDTPLRVLIVGTFHEKKGIPYALEALGRIKDKAELEITVIGDSTKQDRSRQEKARIHETIEKWGLAPHTRLAGFQPFETLFEESYRHHVFVSPSVTASDGDTEGGAPVTVVEMAASGMPVVSSRHCDIPEVIREEAGGLLADERDVDGLVDRLNTLIEQPDRWASITQAARAHIDQEFDARRQGERLAGHYVGLANNRNGPD